MAAKEKGKDKTTSDSTPIKVRMQSQVLEIELEGKETMLQTQLPDLMKKFHELSAEVVNQPTRLDLLEHTQTAQRLTTALKVSQDNLIILLKKMDDEYKLLDEEFLKFMRLVNNAAAQPDELHNQVTDLIKQRDPRKTDFQTTVSRTLSLKSQIEQAIAQLEAQQQAILDGIAKIK
jgi:uncharacterized membrane-anchored protein YhcB (DUF1043 family)